MRNKSNPIFQNLLLGLLLLGLSACLTPSARIDENSSRIDTATLPKFGTDPHWGSHQVPPAILDHRNTLFAELAKQNSTPEQFVLDVTQSGWESMAQQDFVTAMRRFNQAWLVDPNASYAIMGMGMIVFERDGDTQGAIQLLTSLEELLAQDGSYWINRASIEQRAQFSEESIEHYQRALQFLPNNPIAIRELITLYAQFQNFSYACLMLKHARSIAIPIDQQLAHHIDSNVEQSCSPS